MPKQATRARFSGRDRKRVPSAWNTATRIWANVVLPEPPDLPRTCQHESQRKGGGVQWHSCIVHSPADPDHQAGIRIGVAHPTQPCTQRKIGVPHGVHGDSEGTGQPRSRDLQQTGLTELRARRQQVSVEWLPTRAGRQPKSRCAAGTRCPDGRSFQHEACSFGPSNPSRSVSRTVRE